jgi:hypothetical protein
MIVVRSTAEALRELVASHDTGRDVGNFTQRLYRLENAPIADALELPFAGHLLAQDFVHRTSIEDLPIGDVDERVQEIPSASSRTGSQQIDLRVVPGVRGQNFGTECFFIRGNEILNVVEKQVIGAALKIYLDICQTQLPVAVEVTSIDAFEIAILEPLDFLDVVPGIQTSFQLIVAR